MRYQYILPLVPFITWLTWWLWPPTQMKAVAAVAPQVRDGFEFVCTLPGETGQQRIWWSGHGVSEWTMHDVDDDGELRYELVDENGVLLARLYPIDGTSGIVEVADGNTYEAIVVHWVEEDPNGNVLHVNEDLETTMEAAVLHGRSPYIAECQSMCLDNEQPIAQPRARCYASLTNGTGACRAVYVEDAGPPPHDNSLCGVCCLFYWDDGVGSGCPGPMNTTSHSVQE